MNLSLGGALVAAGTQLPMGQRVTISFIVPTMEEAIEVGATVRWSDDKATGIQFDGLRARDVWALNKYFEQLPALVLIAVAGVAGGALRMRRSRHERVAVIDLGPADRATAPRARGGGRRRPASSP